MSLTLAQGSVTALALVALALASLLYCRIRATPALVLWPLKMLAGSLAPFAAIGGLLAALLGVALHAPLAAAAGAASTLLAAAHLVRIACCTPEQTPELAKRQSHAGLPAVAGKHNHRPPLLRWTRDVPFAVPSGSSRPLLCDIWQPAGGIPPTGLAIVYLHSSSWHLADKDVWTRWLFRHLAAQGHVVMDVAYRLCPEVDLWGMLGDAKRAMAWMRANAARYGAQPERLVAMGASAGGQLALLAAYTAGDAALAPPDLAGADTSVCAVVSYYGLADMHAYDAHAAALLPGPGLVRTVARRPVLLAVDRLAGLVPGRPIAGQACKLAGMSHAGMMASLLGGLREHVPGAYDGASPLNHVGPHCPPTLLVHGAHDTAVPAAPTRLLYQELQAAGVPAACLILPQTDHIFDLVLPQVSPAAHVALAQLDRFLACVA